MAGSNASMRMADRLTGGRLKDILTEYRKVKAPWPAIADHLRVEFGVEVTGDTLRNWGQKLRLEDSSTDAEAAS